MPVFTTDGAPPRLRLWEYYRMTSPVCYALDREPSDGPSWAPEPEDYARNAFVASGRILVVDDEHIVRRWITRLLEEAGYTVLTASDGDQALGMALEDPVGVDLIVTDVRMPGMDGWQLGRRVRAAWPGLPVLYISGYDLHQSAPGPHAFLRKPFESEDLLRRVADLLRTR